MRLSDLPVFFLDFQTTGPKPETSQILEMAWATKSKETIESFLIELPDHRMPPRHIQELTGIGEKEMQDAKPFTEVFEKFKKFLEMHNVENGTAVIHFAQFEKPFLKDAYEKLEWNQQFQVLCTHEIAKRLFPNLPTRGIKGLAGYYGYPVEDLKRSRCHVEATQTIWQGLIGSLKEKNIETLEDLQTWMAATPKVARTKYEYPLAKEKRLSLPKKPGIYRMISKTGEVLYVGKATSLRDRVNSYFRGQKNRDPKKLEMLTQVWDLIVTPCESPLEAAIMETDEIKKLNPRYNVSLKTGQRNMVFFDRSFASLSRSQDEEHKLGPFSNPFVLDSVTKLSQSIVANSMNRYMFWDPIDPEILDSGFNLFCERHSLKRENFSSVRNILALGLFWYRDLLKLNNQESEILETETDNSDEIVLPDENPQEEFLTEEEILELTPEDIADKYERHFIRAGKAYWRAREMTKLLNSEIHFQDAENKEKRKLVFQRGQILNKDFVETESSQYLWEGLDIQTYDRMTVLNSELAKIRSNHGEVDIRPLRRFKNETSESEVQH